MIDLRKSRPSRAGRLLLITLSLFLLNACGSRHVQDSLAGSTAQRLVSHGIDDLVRALPGRDFEGLRGKRLRLHSHFVEDSPLKNYADQRLAMELRQRFGIEVVFEGEAEQLMTVFYTSLGTDQGKLGFYIPLGFVPGLAETTHINLITLEQFHGVAELYYFIGPEGEQARGRLLQARVRSDAIGLPVITIPISNLDYGWD